MTLTTKPKPEAMVIIGGIIPRQLKVDFDAYVKRRKAKKQDVLESAIREYLKRRTNGV